MGEPKHVTLVESQRPLLVQTLDALPVSSIHRRPVGLVQPHLARGLHNVRVLSRLPLSNFGRQPLQSRLLRASQRGRFGSRLRAQHLTDDRGLSLGLCLSDIAVGCEVRQD